MRVWGGFHTQSEIFEDAIEMLQEDWFLDEPIEERDEEATAKIISSELAKKSEAEAQWPAETDCDRLTRALEALTATGIVSLENAGYTLSDGWSDYQEVVQNEWSEGDLLSPVRGGCFYHQQDLERAITGGGLDLAFGSVTGEDPDSCKIAIEIVEQLRALGFKPEWNGTVGQRIHLPIEWQRRFGPAADPSPR